MAHNQDWREWLESSNASGVEYVVGVGIAAGRPQDIADIERLGG